jgi:hypothetical protein
MRNIISVKMATNGILILLASIIFFHLLIITSILPYQIVWGGRLHNRAEMLQFESISIGINALMLFLVSIKASWIQVQIPRRTEKIAFWLMFGLFSLNTLGNLFAINDFEKIVFTPITFILAVLCLRIAIEK